MQLGPYGTSTSALDLRAFCNLILGLEFMQFNP
jgi:hypothetical protein